MLNRAVFSINLLASRGRKSRLFADASSSSSSSSMKRNFGCRTFSSSSTTAAAPEEEEQRERPPVPPFTEATAVQKIRAAEDAWNSQDPHKVSLAYSKDTVWRNRSEFLTGRDEVRRFLAGKWERELDYRLIKELWAFSANRIAVRFAYEYRSAENKWFRAYGNENWEFDPDGRMKFRHASINDVPIQESERKFHWPKGSRPSDHPGLTELGL